MPFLRFSRDKRGYENFFIVQPARGRGRQPRVLYWFRTPPNVRVGRDPFGPAVQRAIEAQNPDLTFDWETLLNTPIPSAEPEPWRERRDAERRAKAGRAAAEATRDADRDASDSLEPAPAESLPPDLAQPEALVDSSIVEGSQPATNEPADPAQRRRRRRRGRRGRQAQSAEAVPAGAATGEADSESSPTAPAAPDSPDNEPDV